MTIEHIEQISANTLNEAIEGERGFCLAHLTLEDLASLRDLIKEQYLHVLQMNCPRLVAQYHAKSMNQYHEIYPGEGFEHGHVWQKKSRVLGPRAVKTIKSMPFFQRLQVLLGKFSIADEEEFGWPGIYWRLVRPGSDDVGPVHADKWFWDLGHGAMQNGYKRLKVWISIYTVAGKSGLRVVPGSHLRDDWKYHGERRGDIVKPVLDEHEEDLELNNLTMDAGQFVVFHDKLLHGGMPNISESSRVSLEFTILIPE